MSIASEITRLQGAKADIKSAIEAKGVTVPSNATLDGYGDYIEQISGGGGPDFDDWVKDGDTHLWIELVSPHQFEITIRIRMIGTIDWGDGTAKDTANVTAYTTFSHTYTELGKYRIDLHPTSGRFYLGNNSNGYNIMGARDNDDAYRNSTLYQVEIGTSIITQISNYSFYYCRGLRRAYIPKNITALGTYTFHYCYALQEVIFEDSSTITDTALTNNFGYSYGLQVVSNFAPPMVRTMSATFRQCVSLMEMTIPATVTSIVAASFETTTGLKYLYCLPTTPPTPAAATAISFGSSCIIKVPIGSLSSYQSASLWSAHSSKMVEAGTVTQTLTNVVSSNKALMVDKNSSYSTTLTAKEGYSLGTVTVEMGGTDITNTAYSSGVVSIASVTGNIVITASAS